MELLLFVQSGSINNSTDGYVDISVERFCKHHPAVEIVGYCSQKLKLGFWWSGWSPHTEQGVRDLTGMGTRKGDLPRCVLADLDNI